MSRNAFDRPALVRLARWRPALVAGAVILAGAWLFSLGGWVFWPLGAAVAALGAGWLAVEVAHLRLRGQADGPGLVEVEEGALRYYAARALGGEVALRDLAEIRILRLGGRAHWRLRTSGGEALLIPADAAARAHSRTHSPASPAPIWDDSPPPCPARGRRAVPPC